MIFADTGYFLALISPEDELHERGQNIRQALAQDEHFEQAGFEALLRHDPES